MLGYMGKRMEDVAKAMKPEKHFVAVRKSSHYDTRVYQSTQHRRRHHGLQSQEAWSTSICRAGTCPTCS